MDSALRALAEHVEATAEAPVGVRLALTSGHTVHGTLIPNCDLEPVVMARIDQALSRGRGKRRAAPVIEAPADDSMRVLRGVLSSPADGSTLTLGEATVQMPGGGSLLVPVMRIEGEHVAAWWIIGDGIA